jgi:hypothetical protein
LFGRTAAESPDAVVADDGFFDGMTELIWAHDITGIRYDAPNIEP